MFIKVIKFVAIQLSFFTKIHSKNSNLILCHRKTLFHKLQFEYLFILKKISLKLTRKHHQLVIADFHTILHKQSVKCPYTWSIGFTSQHAQGRVSMNSAHQDNSSTIRDNSNIAIIAKHSNSSHTNSTESANN